MQKDAAGTALWTGTGGGAGAGGGKAHPGGPGLVRALPPGGHPPEAVEAAGGAFGAVPARPLFAGQGH